MQPSSPQVPWISGLLVGLVVSCSQQPPARESGSSSPPRAVQIVAVERRPMERIIAVSGSLAAQEKAVIGIKVSGRVKTMAVDIGSVVRLGDLIAQVEPRDYELRVQQAAAALSQTRALVGLPLEGTDDQFEPEKTSAVRQAKALLEEATKTHDRIKRLFEEGVIPRSDLDTVLSVYTVALNRHEASLEEARTRQAVLAQRRAEYEMARQQLTDTTVRAPFPGIIQNRLIGLGEFLAAGSRVVELVQKDILRLRLEVPEREAAAVRAQQPVRLTIEGDTNVYSGHLARISPALNEQTRGLMVEADVPGQGTLRPGLFARARIVVREDDPGLAVPANSLVIFAGLEKVLSLRDGKAVERLVTTGRRGSDWVEILTGLKEGETIIVNPGNLRSGQPVAVSEPVPDKGDRSPQVSGP